LDDFAEVPMTMKRAPQLRRTATSLALGLAAGMAALAAAPPAALAADAKDKPEAGPTMTQFNRLEREVTEQRQLIIQMLQMEQDRYNMLLKLIQSGGALPPGSSLPPAGGLPSLPPADHAGPPAAEAEAPAADKTAALGTVTGRVQARSGRLKDTYVYLDQVRGGSAHGRTLEIKQKDKQFSPQVAVVLRGTNVVFPNFDSIYHSVFSTSGRNSFDLGAYRAGETPRAVVLNTPGVVDVYCNIHARMSAAILVVPSPVYTKVSSDGSFRLENVPVGSRKIVAWSPNAKPGQQRIDVTAEGAQASFTLETLPSTNHANKLGQPYGSYKD
jgi:plastocyanin